MVMTVQKDFSEKYADVVFDQEGRSQKAKKTLAVLEDYCGNLNGLTLLDIGCPTGFMTFQYGKAFKHVIGIDIDRHAIEYARCHS